MKSGGAFLCFGLGGDWVGAAEEGPAAVFANGPAAGLGEDGVGVQAGEGDGSEVLVIGGQGSRAGGRLPLVGAGDFYGQLAALFGGDNDKVTYLHFVIKAPKAGSAKAEVSETGVDLPDGPADFPCGAVRGLAQVSYIAPANPNLAGFADDIHNAGGIDVVGN